MSKITVYGKNRRGNWKKIGLWQAPENYHPDAGISRYAVYKSIELRRLKTNQFRIEVVPYGVLPAGHPGAGNQAWLFLDEFVFQ